MYRSPLVNPSRIGTMSAAMRHSLTTEVMGPVIQDAQRIAGRYDIRRSTSDDTILTWTTVWPAARSYGGGTVVRVMWRSVGRGSQILQ